MKNKKFVYLILFMIITLISTACKISLGGNQPTKEPIPVSADAAATLEAILNSAALANQQSKSVAFTVTEEQVTSLAAQEIAKTPNSTIRDPQIYLRDGKIDVYAVYTQQSFDMNIHMTLSAAIDENHELSLNLENVDVGGLPAPQSFLDSISSVLDDSITSSLLPAVTGFQMESIYIADGMATISGTIIS